MRDSTLAVALGEGTLELRRAEDGALFRAIPAHADGLLACAAAPDQTTVATGGMDGFVRIWSASGELQHEERLRGWVDQLAYAGNDCVLAGAGRVLASLHGGRITTRELPAAALALDAGRTRTGDKVALVAYANSVSSFDVGTLVLRDVHPFTTQIRSLRLSPSGAVAALAGQDTNLRIVRLSDGTSGPLSGYIRTPKSLSFSPDGALLATSGLDLGVVWLLPDGTAQSAEPIIVRLDGSPTQHVAFHPAHPRLAVATQAGVYLLDARADQGVLHHASVVGLPSTLGWSGADVIAGTTTGQLLAFRAES